MLKIESITKVRWPLSEDTAVGDSRAAHHKTTSSWWELNAPMNLQGNLADGWVREIPDMIYLSVQVSGIYKTRR